MTGAVHVRDDSIGAKAPPIDMSCPDARLLADVHDRRARIALGLHGSRLESVVREQRAAEFAAHARTCLRCLANARVCRHCGHDRAAHSFWCKERPHRWRSLFAKLFAKRPKRARRSHIRVAERPEDVLGVRVGATMTEARSAYLALAKRYHPDLWAKAKRREREAAGQRMREINEAYEAFTRVRRGA